MTTIPGYKLTRQAPEEVQQYANLAAFPATGVEGAIYIAADTGLVFRWDGADYAAVGSGNIIPWDMTPVSGGPFEYLYDASEAQYSAAGVAPHPTVTADRKYGFTVAAGGVTYYAFSAQGIETMMTPPQGDVTIPATDILQFQVTFSGIPSLPNAGSVLRSAWFVGGTPGVDSFSLQLILWHDGAGSRIVVKSSTETAGVVSNGAVPDVALPAGPAEVNAVVYFDTVTRKLGFAVNGVDKGYIVDSAAAALVVPAAVTKAMIYLESNITDIVAGDPLIGASLNFKTDTVPANFVYPAIGTPASWGVGRASDPLIPAGATLLEVTVAGSYAGTAYSVGDIGVVHINGIDVTRVPTQGRSATQITDEIAAAITAHNDATDPHPGYALESTKGVANGIATLDEAGKVPLAQLPNYAQTNVTASRALDTTYTNTGTKSIFINATVRCAVSVAGGIATAQGKSDTATPPTTIASGLVGIQSGLQGEDNTYAVPSFVVAPGANYRIDSAVTNGTVTLGSWFEVSL